MLSLALELDLEIVLEWDLLCWRQKWRWFFFWANSILSAVPELLRSPPSIPNPFSHLAWKDSTLNWKSVELSHNEYIFYFNLINLWKAKFKFLFVLSFGTVNFWRKIVFIRVGLDWLRQRSLSVLGCTAGGSAPRKDFPKVPLWKARWRGTKSQSCVEKWHFQVSELKKSLWFPLLLSIQSCLLMHVWWRHQGDRRRSNDLFWHLSGWRQQVQGGETESWTSRARKVTLSKGIFWHSSWLDFFRPFWN